MSAEVYVGKNVGVVLQVPRTEDESDKLKDLYNYQDVPPGQATFHKAYDHAGPSELPPPFGLELPSAEYNKIATSNDVRHSYSTLVDLEYAMMLFRFKCEFMESKVQKVLATFEGYGTAPAGNGITVKIWDHNGSAWVNPQTGTLGSDEEIVITKTTGLINYIDPSGYIYLLARTTNPSDGATAAVIYCDKMKCLVTKKEFTVDKTPISDLDMDGIADEPAHVTVKKNGSEVTVSSVDDDTGLVTLASGDFVEGDRIECEYRHDVEPHIAQEFAIEPKQEIEGLDGLGSDLVQAWAVKGKGYEGHLKEVFHSEDQLRRLRTFKPRYRLRDDFNNLDNWKTLSGTPTIENGQLRLDAGDKVRLKNFTFKNGRIVFKVSRYGAYYGYVHVRVNGNKYSFVYEEWESGLIRSSDAKYILCTTVAGVATPGTITVVLEFQDNRISVWFNGAFKGCVEDTTAPEEGYIELEQTGANYKLFDYFYVTDFDEREHGIIAKWDDGQGNVVKVGFDSVLFPAGSIPSPKGEVVYSETPFRAKTEKVIT